MDTGGSGGGGVVLRCILGGYPSFNLRVYYGRVIIYGNGKTPFVF